MSYDCLDVEVEVEVDVEVDVEVEVLSEHTECVSGSLVTLDVSSMSVSSSDGDDERDDEPDDGGEIIGVRSAGESGDGSIVF